MECVVLVHYHLRKTCGVDVLALVLRLYSTSAERVPFNIRTGHYFGKGTGRDGPLIVGSRGGMQWFTVVWYSGRADQPTCMGGAGLFLYSRAGSGCLSFQG